MGFCVAQIAEKLFEVMLMRIWVTVKTQKIYRGNIAIWRDIRSFAQGYRRTVGILICVEKNVRAVVFVVTELLTIYIDRGFW